MFDIRRADETRTAELLRDGTVMAAVTASARLVEFDPRTIVDVPLFWQQWRRASGTLGRVSAAVRAQAGSALRPRG